MDGCVDLRLRGKDLFPLCHCQGQGQILARFPKKATSATRYNHKQLMHRKVVETQSTSCTLHVKHYGQGPSESTHPMYRKQSFTPPRSPRNA